MKFYGALQYAIKTGNGVRLPDCDWYLALDAEGSFAVFDKNRYILSDKVLGHSDLQSTRWESYRHISGMSIKELPDEAEKRYSTRILTG